MIYPLNKQLNSPDPSPSLYVAQARKKLPILIALALLALLVIAWCFAASCLVELMRRDQRLRVAIRRWRRILQDIMA